MSVLISSKAIQVMSMKHKYCELQSKNLTETQWAVVQKVYDILDYPHSVQHLMVGETTPILSGTLPAFQSLQDQWQEHMISNLDMSPYVLKGMAWLNKYHEKVGKTHAYVIAMVLNPSIKMYFIQKQWSPMEVEEAVEWIKDELTKYWTIANTRPSVVGTASKLSQSTHIKLSLIDADDDFNTGALSIDQEYEAYMVHLWRTLTLSQKPILTFWQEHEYMLPMWFQMAMDYLPIQASSVPSEQTPMADMMVDLDNGGDMLRDILNTAPTEIDEVLEHLMDHEDLITDE
ncbi:hypothetical protein BS47DRAFT_1401372 [Hydnum rufescens UP504]|uniref:Uncharacterized protein n=1 Tax=Hydnum rufescens UP504 TaxID=1448309 RepID=A0A9P6AFW3_9AGAM|nr:hypothetical protein BS47DRAFT_1401372 [Hydnum rufescens UP504]